MAVRFSAVKLTANEQECKLLVSGVPTSLSDTVSRLSKMMPVNFLF